MAHAQHYGHVGSRIILLLFIIIVVAAATTFRHYNSIILLLNCIVPALFRLLHFISIAVFAQQCVNDT